MTGESNEDIRSLRALAKEMGVQTAYRATSGRRRSASVEALLATVRALGAEVARPEDAARALRTVRAARSSRVLDPVMVATHGRLTATARLPARQAGRTLSWRLVLESGEELTDGWVAREPQEDEDDPGMVRVAATRRDRLPPGYHGLTMTSGRSTATSRVISTHPRAPRDDRQRGWGVFMPLYALRSGRSWGVGDLTDLGDLAEWAGGLGCESVATLPLLASFLDEPFDPSPYSPASRLFWNELYLDVTSVPELARSAKARARLGSNLASGTVRGLNDMPLVDYRRATWAKRKVLEALCEAFFAEPQGERWEAFRRFLATKPAAAQYARFRAAGEVHRTPWMDWPARERAGRLPPSGGNQDAFRYHQYVQWLAAEQLDRVAERAGNAGTGLTFDMPLGVNPASFDVWRDREGFAMGCSVGAPPDQFFTEGQDWGFFPPHPERIREHEYRYQIACLRHLLRHPNVLRIDHAMGLHRLYWVPPGMPATDGAYVRYHARELYAIVDVESRRAGVTIVGEDLGTVLAEVRAALARSMVHHSWVLPFEVITSPRPSLRTPPRRSFASLNTHDMAPFAGYWKGLDLDQRRALGWVNDRRAKADRQARDRQTGALVTFLRRTGRLPRSGPVRPRAVMDGILDHLSAGPARMVMVTLEDLWQEARPQNVPGTVDEYPNWRRVARHRLERIRTLPSVVRTLRRIDAIRRGSTSP